MATIKRIGAITLGIVFILSSCTVQKRVHMTGYHVEWKKSRKAAQAGLAVEKNATPAGKVVTDNSGELVLPGTMPAEFSEMPVAEQTQQSLLASAGEEITFVPNKRVTIFSGTGSAAAAPLAFSMNLKASQDNLVTTHAKAVKKPAAAAAGKSQVVALVLAIFLGLLGVHRFYLGYTGLGILYLLTGGILGIGWIIDIIRLIIPNGLTPKGKSNYND